MANLEIRGPGVSMVLPLQGNRVAIGRRDDNGIALTGDIRVSRVHASLDFVSGEWTIRDLKSTNGSFVNGERITEPTRLKPGDTVRIGNTTLHFRGNVDGEATMHSAEHHAVAAASSLTTREQEILALVASGWTDQDIATELIISVQTVRSHLDRVRDKTGCRRRPDLTRLAFELGLLRSDSPAKPS